MSIKTLLGLENASVSNEDLNTVLYETNKMNKKMKIGGTSITFEDTDDDHLECGILD